MQQFTVQENKYVGSWKASGNSSLIFCLTKNGHSRIAKEIGIRQNE